MHGQKVEVVNVMKYLGVYFSSNGLWTQHTKRALAKVNGTLKLLFKFYARYPELTTKFNNQLYRPQVSLVILTNKRFVFALFSCMSFPSVRPTRDCLVAIQKSF